MILKMDMTSAVPIYVQLRNQIVMGIGRGELVKGQGLPTVRQMAQELGVNMMTVTKAYTLLRNEGFIEIDRRHGAKISPVTQPDAKFREKLEHELELLIAESQIKGIPGEDFAQLCEKLYKRMNSFQPAEG